MKFVIYTTELLIDRGLPIISILTETSWKTKCLFPLRKLTTEYKDVNKDEVKLQGKKFVTLENCRYRKQLQEMITNCDSFWD